MFCGKCGKELKEDDKFCAGCGAKIEMVSSKKMLLIVAPMMGVIAIAMCAIFLLYINNDIVKNNQQLEQAQRYLLKKEYEQAIDVYEYVIETDAKNIEAYIGLAEAYAQTDNLEKAVKILEKGFEENDFLQVRKLLNEHIQESPTGEDNTVQSFTEIPHTLEEAQSIQETISNDMIISEPKPIITIGFAQIGNGSDWINTSTNSFWKVFIEEKGYELQVVDCDYDSTVQIDAARNFIEQDVDYIIINPLPSTGWDLVLTECENADIPVIIIEHTIDDSDKYVSWVGSNFKTEGLAAGEWLKAYTEIKGIAEINALVIEGAEGASATVGRTEGFMEIAYREGWNILDSRSGDFTQDGGQEVMESYCKSYEGQFNVVICQNDYEALGAMDAMKKAGVSYGEGGEVILVSFDACAALEHVFLGDINADFENNPLIAPFVEEVIQTLENGEIPDKKVYIEEHVYVNEDIISSIIVNGKSQELTVVDQDIINMRY